jgi:hypothetical protein
MQLIRWGASYLFIYLFIGLQRAQEKKTMKGPQNRRFYFQV